jgi:hypothetical protein
MTGAPVNESLEETRRYVRRKRIFYTTLGDLGLSPFNDGYADFLV